MGLVYLTNNKSTNSSCVLMYSVYKALNSEMTRTSTLLTISQFDLHSNYSADTTDMWTMRCVLKLLLTIGNARWVWG